MNVYFFIERHVQARTRSFVCLIWLSCFVVLTKRCKLLTWSVAYSYFSWVLYRFSYNHRCIYMFWSYFICSIFVNNSDTILCKFVSLLSFCTILNFDVFVLQISLKECQRYTHLCTRILTNKNNCLIYYVLSNMGF